MGYLCCPFLKILRLEYFSFNILAGLLEKILLELEHVSSYTSFDSHLALHSSSVSQTTVDFLHSLTLTPLIPTRLPSARRNATALYLGLRLGRCFPQNKEKLTNVEIFEFGKAELSEGAS